MTKEEFVRKDSWILAVIRDRCELTQAETDYLNILIEVLEQEPTAKENLVVEQIKWERDIAIEQLKEIGYGLGEKIRTDEDCISRKDVMVAINTTCVHYELARKLRKLPTICPKAKTGHWERETFDLGNNLPIRVAYQCSECGEYFDGEFKFCPNCGARMESEDI